MPGAIAPNLSEGYRSESLAQFALSAFGTAVGIPTHADHGLDLHCTLTERIGQRAWAREYYFVQVKSTMDPWVFATPMEVEWLIRHPFPIFLCVVNKNEARIRVYQVNARFSAWAYGGLPESLVLVPSEETVNSQMPIFRRGEPCSLGAPALDFTVQNLGDAEIRDRLRQTLLSWIEFEAANLRRARLGIRRFMMPATYKPNEPVFDPAIGGGGGSYRLPKDQLESIAAQIAEAVGFVAEDYGHHGDLVTGACGAIFLGRSCGIGRETMLGKLFFDINDHLGLPQSAEATEGLRLIEAEIERFLKR